MEEPFQQIDVINSVKVYFFLYAVKRCKMYLIIWNGKTSLLKR